MIRHCLPLISRFIFADYSSVAPLWLSELAALQQPRRASSDVRLHGAVLLEQLIGAGSFVKLGLVGAVRCIGRESQFTTGEKESGAILKKKLHQRKTQANLSLTPRLDRTGSDLR